MHKTSVIAATVILAACSVAQPPIDQRTTQGPSSQDFFLARTAIETGREPTFEERRHWDNQTEERISDYLREHPDVANSLNVSTFRFERRVVVGMSKEQVSILIGEPVTMTQDPAEMEKLARQHWPGVRSRKVTEAWMYPEGWQLYFAGEKLVDIAQYYKR